MTLELLESKTGRTLIEFHRGMEGDLPENSWPAIQLGHKFGADLIEVEYWDQSSDFFDRYEIECFLAQVLWKRKGF